MAQGSLFRAWWARLRGRLEPVPFPFDEARVLDTPLRRWFASPDRVLGAFGLREGERVVEIGPGTGYYSVEAARRVGARGRLVCLDLQAQMLGAVRRRLCAAAVGQADCVRASAEALPLAAGSADHVFLVTVLGEIPDRRRALAEIHRVLRPGGRLSVCEQLPDPDFVTRATLRRELPAAGFAEEATRGSLVVTSTWRR